MRGLQALTIISEQRGTRRGLIAVAVKTLQGFGPPILPSQDKMLLTVNDHAVDVHCSSTQREGFAVALNASSRKKTEIFVHKQFSVGEEGGVHRTLCIGTRPTDFLRVWGLWYHSASPFRLPAPLIFRFKSAEPVEPTGS